MQAAIWSASQMAAVFYSENFEDCCDIWLYMSIKYAK